MKCPSCHFEDSRVLDSRPTGDGDSIRRRRECPACGKRFTTYEVIDTVPITVRKRDGHTEFFNLNKLKLGIERACLKRPVDYAEVAESIENELQNALVSEVTTTEIGEMVLARLRDIDTVSYIRFASVYREFVDIDSFMNEIRALSKKERRIRKQTKADKED